MILHPGSDLQTPLDGSADSNFTPLPGPNLDFFSVKYTTL